MQNQCRSLALCLAILFPLISNPWMAIGAEPAAPTKPVYDESADAAKDVAAAVKLAGYENQRVLLVMGGNWCGWCRLLHTLMTTDKDIKLLLRNEYRVVNIDIGHGEKNADLLKSYGIKCEGYPYLAILDSDNKLITQQETGALEAGPKHDPEKVLAFLTKWKATPLDAQKVLDSAIADAKANDKRVFVHFGAPWCGWCHKLEDVLYQPAVADAIAADYVMVKIDTDRMTGGPEVLKKYQTSGGIPWYMTLDAGGKVLSTSDITPGNNIGFPTEPREIDHFMAMFTAGHKHMTDEQIKTLRDAITKASAAVKATGH
jgi:thiol:disulfide interchange protein